MNRLISKKRIAIGVSLILLAVALFLVSPAYLPSRHSEDISVEFRTYGTDYDFTAFRKATLSRPGDSEDLQYTQTILHDSDNGSILKTNHRLDNQDSRYIKYEGYHTPDTGNGTPASYSNFTLVKNGTELSNQLCKGNANGSTLGSLSKSQYNNTSQYNSMPYRASATGVVIDTLNLFFKFTEQNTGNKTVYKPVNGIYRIGNKADATVVYVHSTSGRVVTENGNLTSSNLSITFRAWETFSGFPVLKSITGKTHTFSYTANFSEKNISIGEPAWVEHARTCESK